MKNLLAAVVLVMAASCGSTPPTPAPAANGEGAGSATGSAGPACVPGGCSGTVCAEEGDEIMTTCEYRAEYACYQSAACERQEDGACAWTQTDELAACLASGGPAAP